MVGRILGVKIGWKTGERPVEKNGGKDWGGKNWGSGGNVRSGKIGGKQGEVNTGRMVRRTGGKQWGEWEKKWIEEWWEE